MRRAPFLTLALASALAAPSALRAQTIPSPYKYLERAQSLSVDAGYVFLEHGAYDTNPRSGPIFEARYGVRFAGPVSAIAVLGAIPTNRPVYTRASKTAEAVKLAEVRSRLALAEAGLRLSITGPRTWHGLQPFVSGTGGILTDLAGRSELEKQLPGDQLVSLGPSFAVGVSAGTDWYPTERLSLNLRATDHIWRRSTPAGLTNSGTRENAWSNNLGVTVGAALHF